MIQFNRPTNLNGAELIQELNLAGVTVIGNPLADEEGNLWLNIDEKDKTKTETIVNSHNGTIVAPELTIYDKLANAGISIDELKAALGL